MAEILPQGLNSSLGQIDTSQGDFRKQIDVVSSGLAQIIGNADVDKDSTRLVSALNAPFVLYVNPYTGDDTFAGDGNDWSGYDNNDFESKISRISEQRVTCGYSMQRPFRTIERAMLEAAIITSRQYLDLNPAPCGDNVSIMLAPGIYDVNNGAGAAVGSVGAIASGTALTPADLQKFNPELNGGVIIPRGCSLCSLDLRKVFIRPAFVPSSADETLDAVTGSPINRSTIFRLTGNCYAFGLTFGDADGATSSHHLLSCFEFAGSTQLTDYYAKIREAFGGIPNGFIENSATGKAVPRQSETRMVGPQPDVATQAVDTVAGSSPYIYNCSSRSRFGLCGMLLDGQASLNPGFRSGLVAQFTGVSLQTDMGCWERYAGGTWTTIPDYATPGDGYLEVSPDDLRMNPARRSFHLRCINGAVLQAVSTFSIGQGVQHWAQSSMGTDGSESSEITLTNSSANFGGVAAIAEGFADKPFQNDEDWEIKRVKRPTDLSDKTRNIQLSYLGIIKAPTINSSTTLVLETDLKGDEPNLPVVLNKDGHSLVDGSLIWIEAQRCKDFYSFVDTAAWDPATPNEIKVKVRFTNEDGVNPGTSVEANGKPGKATGLFASDLVGARVYVRRLKDTRTVRERTISLLMDNTSALGRQPVRDYILQTNTGSTGIAARIPKENTVTVLRSGPAAGTAYDAEVVLRQANAGVIDSNYTTGRLYRAGDVVRNNGKHWTCVIKHVAPTAFDVSFWNESYVYTEDSFEAEDFFKNEAQIIVFDNDTDATSNSTTLGWDLTNCWTTDPTIQRQYESCTDWKGAYSFLRSMGYLATDARSILAPKPLGDDGFAPADAASPLPSGGAANGRSDFSVYFLRMTNIRAFGNAYEWTGYSNYSKALPKYQAELSEQNQFNFFGCDKDGGKVYFSGFNQEGFSVSPQGLENLATGEVLSAEQIGNPDLDLDVPTFFPTLSAGELDVNGQISFGSLTDGDVVITSLREAGPWERLPNGMLEPYDRMDFLDGGDF